MSHRDNVRPTEPAPATAPHPASLGGNRAEEDRNLFEAPDHEVGSRAVVRAVQDMKFPLSRDALVAEVGDRHIPLGGGKVAPLRQVLNRIPTQTFHNPQDVVKAVNENWNLVDRIQESV